MRTTILLLMLGLFPLALPTPAETTAAGDASQVSIRETPDCPVRILREKTRVVDPRLLLDRGEDSLATQEMYKRKFFGATERQVVYDVTYRNESTQNLVDIAFIWTAYNAAGERVYRRMGHDGREGPVAPSSVRVLHDLDLMFPGEVARYEVSLLKALFADGSVCEGLKDNASRP